MESYSLPGFAGFYDAMVAHLPPEYEAGADVGLFWSLLLPTLKATGAVSVLDLCTGTGRVVAGLAGRLAAAGRPGWALRCVGLDSSGEMLKAAAVKLPPSALPTGLSCCWVQGDIAALPSTTDLGGPFDFIALSAGSFHHLLTAEAQLACLSGVRRLLAGGGASRAVLNIFPASHLRASAGQVMMVGNYRRECLAERVEELPEGGRVYRQHYLLTKLPSTAGQEQEEQQQHQRASRSGGGDGIGSPGSRRRSSSSDGGSEAAPDWQEEEGWALRALRPGELRQLLAEAGLEVVEQRASFGGGSGWGGEGRVFVVRAGPVPEGGEGLCARGSASGRAGAAGGAALPPISE